MIRMIGFQRFLILLILIGVTGGLAFANFTIFRPQALTAMKELNGLQTEEAKLRDEINTMKTNMDKFTEQKALFDQLSRRGFFSDQDRVNAREQFDQMQKMSKVVSLKYEIRAASMKDPEGITDDKYSLLTSPIAIRVSAIDDLDVYRFIHMLTYAFPGNISIKELKIERPLRLTPEILKGIGTGMTTPLIESVMEVEWNTIAPKGIVPMAPGSEAIPQ